MIFSNCRLVQCISTMNNSINCQSQDSLQIQQKCGIPYILTNRQIHASFQHFESNQNIYFTFFMKIVMVPDILFEIVATSLRDYTIIVQIFCLENDISTSWTFFIEINHWRGWNGEERYSEYIIFGNHIFFDSNKIIKSFRIPSSVNMNRKDKCNSKSVVRKPQL